MKLNTPQEIDFRADYFYAHWPFCKHKCHYCDFVALEGHDQFQHDYHQALCFELDKYLKGQITKLAPKTLFFGGGTPSLYPLELITQFFDVLYVSIDKSRLNEVTLEVNPGNLTEEHFKTWKSLGINRLSLGVQVLDEAVLKKLNRYQSNQDVYDFFELASPYFSNISADLILGLPGVTDKTWWFTLETLMKKPLTHISVYFLTVHESTPLHFKVKKGTIALQTDDALVERYLATVEFLASHGFIQYETSNFAREGYQSEHNKAYWNYQPYRAFGIGASSFDGSRRFRNEKNLTRYIASQGVWNGTTVPEDRAASVSEALTLEQVHLERVMLALRQTEGIEIKLLVELFGPAKAAEMLERVATCVEKGLIHPHKEKIMLTPQGLALEHEIVLFILR